MDRKTGYLASFNNTPPLIFRFQFNPELLTEKKTFKYDPANAFGKWGLDQTAAESGLGKFVGFYKDVEEWGSLLIGVKPLEPVEGDPRTFELEFKLDASVPGPLDGDDHYGGSSLPDSPCSARSWCRAGRRPTWRRCSWAAKWVCFTNPPRARSTTRR